MAVSLSPVGGAAQQFFDNNGQPLSGGKIYTYVSGTTSPQTTYTSSTGATAHTNPITLDSAGRVPGGELWLTNNLQYKFILNTAAGGLIGTYDNISASIPSASLITYTPPFTGSVATTVQNKLAQSISVKDFGAVGNGTTDDTAAIQAALTAGAGKTVIFPPATYKTGALTAFDNTILNLSGATLNFSAAGNITGLTLGSNCTVIKGELIGAGGGTYSASGIAISAKGIRGANDATAPTYVTGPKINDVTIRNWAFTGIELGYVTGTYIGNCNIQNIGYAAIGGVSCNTTRIYSNYIDGVNGTGAPDWYGIFVDRMEGTELRDPVSKDCQITNNTVKNVTNWEAIDTHGGRDFVISNNFIEGCRFGVAVVGSDINGVNSLGAKRVHIDGNIIKGGADGAAIIVVGAVTGTTVNDYAESVNVTNNIITAGGRVNDSAEGCIRVYATQQLEICGNSLSRPWRIGINVSFQNINFSITNNTIVDACDTTSAFPSCLSITSSDNIGRIANNTFVFKDAAASTYVSVLSIGISSSLSNLNVEIGSCSLLGVSTTKLLYSEATSTGVNASNFQQQRGTATISLSNAANSANVVVTFPTVFAAAPKSVSVTAIAGAIAGGKGFDLTLAAAPSVTSATFVARSNDWANFITSGNVTISWVVGI